MIGHQIRNKMTNHGTIRYGIEVAIPVVLAHNFQLVLPVGTQQDLAGGNIRIRIPLRLIYYDVTANKVILFILVVLILTYFCLLFGCGVEIVLFLVRLSSAFFYIFFDGTPILHISSSWVKIRLYTENQLPRLSGSGLKVCCVVGVCRWGGLHTNSLVKPTLY